MCGALVLAAVLCECCAVSGLRGRALVRCTLVSGAELLTSARAT